MNARKMTYHRGTPLANFKVVIFFETGSLYYSSLAVLELALQTRLASNSEVQPASAPKCWD